MTFRDKQNRMVEISLVMAESGIDWTKDFFNVGNLEATEDGIFLVDCIDDLEAAASDYVRHEGDYVDCAANHEASELYINGKLVAVEE